MKAFVSWSGGKDACFSFYKAAQNQDVEVVCLLNMASENGENSRTHGISSKLLNLQAQALGVSIIQGKATWEIYEQEFKKIVAELKKKGVNTGIFGDIDLQAHRDWVERVCQECGIKPLFPLWQKERGDILQEFINCGFEAIVVVTRVEALGPKWIGRRINEKFIEDLRKIDGVDLCGEAGEYHTFVTSGPIFKKKIKILETDKTKRDKNWFLDILSYEIANSV